MKIGKVPELNNKLPQKPKHIHESGFQDYLDKEIKKNEGTLDAGMRLQRFIRRI